MFIISLGGVRARPGRRKTTVSERGGRKKLQLRVKGHIAELIFGLTLEGSIGGLIESKD